MNWGPVETGGGNWEIAIGDGDVVDQGVIEEPVGVFRGDHCFAGGGGGSKCRIRASGLSGTGKRMGGRLWLIRESNAGGSRRLGEEKKKADDGGGIFFWWQVGCRVGVVWS